MTPEQRAQIEHHCSRLSLEFARLNDSMQYERLIQLFTPDGVFHRPLAPDRPLQGRAAILGDLRRKPFDLSAHHVCSNILVDVHADDRASGLTYFTVYLHRGPVACAPLPRFDGSIHVGSYADDYVLTSEGWRIGVRRGASKFVVDHGAAAP